MRLRGQGRALAQVESWPWPGWKFSLGVVPPDELRRYASEDGHQAVAFVVAIYSAYSPKKVFPEYGLSEEKAVQYVRRLTSTITFSIRMRYLPLMKHIMYLSRAVHPLSDQDLEGLLTQCRRDNARHRVTGILFYSHGHIAQLFEGEPAIADALFDRISRDGRHSHVQKLVDRPIADRSFADWSMAFHPLESAAFATLQGYLLPAHVPPVPATLNIADATLVELVRVAVFGHDPAIPYLPTFPSPDAPPSAQA